MTRQIDPKDLLELMDRFGGWEPADALVAIRQYAEKKLEPEPTFAEIQREAA